MKQNSYTRFLKSALYEQAVIAEQEQLPFQFGGEPPVPVAGKTTKAGKQV